MCIQNDTQRLRYRRQYWLVKNGILNKLALGISQQNSNARVTPEMMDSRARVTPAISTLIEDKNSRSESS